VQIGRATQDDIEQLAELVWLDTHGEEPTQPALDAFTAELRSWWSSHRDTHFAFVARDSDHAIVGMAWVALVSRVPRPSATGRISADIQTVFVLPDHRQRGVGSALVETAVEHATGVGAARVTVQSGRTAVPMYERLGFQTSGQLLQRVRR
jgi:GNAT superfamily N-acetyltransferase